MKDWRSFPKKKKKGNVTQRMSTAGISRSDTVSLFISVKALLDDWRKQRIAEPPPRAP